METAQERRDKDTLRIVGTGAIVLGAWDMVTTLFVLFGGDFFAMVGAAADASVPATLALVGVEFCLNLFVGLSAHAQSKRPARTRLFRVVCVVLAVFCAFAIVLAAAACALGHMDVVSAVAEAVVDATMLYAYVDLMRASDRLLRLYGHESRPGRKG